MAPAAIPQVRRNLYPLVVWDPDRHLAVSDFRTLDRTGGVGEVRCDLVRCHSSLMLVSLIEPPPTTIGTVWVKARSGSAASRRADQCFCDSFAIRSFRRGIPWST